MRLGADIVEQLFKLKSLADWCVGEIHIIGSDLTPNAGRDNFEDSPGWSKVRGELEYEVIEIEKTIRRESGSRNKSVASLQEKSQKTKAAAVQQIGNGFLTQRGKDQMVENIDKVKDELGKAAVAKKRDLEEKKTLLAEVEDLSTYIDKVKSVKKTGIDDALQHLDKKTRRVVYAILDVLKAEISSEEDIRRIEERIIERLQPGKRM